MPSMSYCLCENTSADMQEILSRMFDNGVKYVKGMNRYERDAYNELYEQCREFMAQYEEIEDKQIESRDTDYLDSDTHLEQVE